MPLNDPRIQTAKKLHADKSMAVSAICGMKLSGNPAVACITFVKLPGVIVNRLHRTFD